MSHYYRIEDEEEASFVGGGNGNLHGESGLEFTHRFTKAIWKANKAFCAVEVTVTDLENSPYETHELNEVAYNAWKERSDD